MRTIGLVAIILIAVFITPVYADVTFSTTREWLVADGTDSCLAIVKVTDGPNPVPDIEVLFAVVETELGTFNTSLRTTDASGNAVARFTVKNKSGNATLKASVSYPSGTLSPVEKQYVQKIDHDTPYSLSSYNVVSEMAVGTTAPIMVSYKDRWGNPIDNRNIAENVAFLVSSPAGDARFMNTSAPFNVVVVPVDEKGEAIAWLQASTKTAINTVRVNPEMGTIPDKYFFILGIANGTPVKITQEFDPEGDPGQPLELYADGTSHCAITYTAADEFGNGISNTPVHITTTLPGEEWTINTNSVGQVMLQYGPKTSLGKVTITASAIGNTTAPPTCSREVRFVRQEAKDTQFTAVPASMASRDVEGWEAARLMAKVIDGSGNPVEGETVTFILGTPVYDETPLPPLVTDPPELGADSAVTDSDGFAIVYFNPGGFSRDMTSEFYDDTASGSSIVSATWVNTTSGESVTKNLRISWKNYPYLSIETDVAPKTVNVTGTVDVLVRLKGDGWALRPAPIDVVLCTDRSGTMLKDQPDDRMVHVMVASRAFTRNMFVSPNQDHIGLVSFGQKDMVSLSPEYRFLNGNYTCKVNGTWKFYPGYYLNGYFYDWTKVYGISGGFTPLLGSGDNFTNVYRDGNWDIDPTLVNQSSNYWPYTVNYDINSDHQKYVTAKYPGSPRNYTDYAVLESSLVNDPTDINEAIDMMVPAGGTPLRYAVYKSINEIRDNGRPDAIRAIIVLSDGDYNWFGDPLARGVAKGSPNNTSAVNPPFTLTTLDYVPFGDLTPSEQNLSVYASNHNITIYSIGYATDISATGKATLRILAESTGGTYYDGTTANIGQIYATIAEELKEEAGADTTMDLYYDRIEVNYNITPVNDTYQVLQYIPETYIDSYYSNMSVPDHSPAYPYRIDQSDEYSLTKKLTFDIGTVKLGQTWEAVYTLQVLENGTINVFGPDSKVLFTGTEGPSQILIPKTYITGIQGLEITDINETILDIDVGSSSDAGTGIATFPITRNYTGTMAVREDYYLSIDGGMTWILVGSATLSPEEENEAGEYTVDLKKYTDGVAEVDIKFKVVGTPLDAPPVTPTASAPPPPPVNKPYIKLY